MLVGEPDAGRAAARSACRRSWSRSAPRARSSSPRAALERVPARPVGGEIDPTGAGDAFTAAYLVSRSSGYAPVPAARRATRARRRTCSAGGSREGARAHGGRRLRGRPRGGAGARPVLRRRSSRSEVPLSLPLVVAAAAVGSTVIAVVDRRPPLAVSNDAGRTWREAGGGLPPGRAIAIAEDDPDHVLYAARNRLYESQERRRLLAGPDPGAAGDRGGRAQGSLNSPRATITALPPTSTRSSALRGPVGPGEQRRRAADLDALGDLDLLAEADAAVAGQVHRERARRPSRWPGPRRRRRPARTCARATSCLRRRSSRRRAAPTDPGARRRPAAAPPAPPPSRARRRRTARRCRSARRGAPTARARAPRAAPRPRRTAATSAAAGASRPKTIRSPSRSSSTGTMPDRVSSRISPSCSGPPSTNAVPSVG